VGQGQQSGFRDIDEAILDDPPPMTARRAKVAIPGLDFSSDR